ncbi:hypothetical protein TNCT_220301, partial [Trichonephila clavata]
QEKRTIQTFSLTWLLRVGKSTPDTSNTADSMFDLEAEVEMEPQGSSFFVFTDDTVSNNGANSSPTFDDPNLSRKIVRRMEVLHACELSVLAQ